MLDSIFSSKDELSILFKTVIASLKCGYLLLLSFFLLYIYIQLLVLLIEIGVRERREILCPLICVAFFLFFDDD